MTRIITIVLILLLLTSSTLADTLRIFWTAPGDDGDQGTATTYDIRWSHQPITDSTWDDSSIVFHFEGEPTPLIAGTEQDYFIPDTFFHPDSVYYIRMKAADEVPNWSLLSNELELQVDHQAPSQINIGIEIIGE